MMSNWICPLLWLIVGTMPRFGIAQPDRVFIHSHNDYAQEAPFYGAYEERAFSIEADVFAVADGRLLVGHDRSELSDDRTLERLYVNPIVTLFETNGGRAWPNSTDRFVLLIDLKTPAANTLHHIVRLVDAYPTVFDARVNPLAVQLVISGDMPSPSAFGDYPPFIWFDGRLAVNYTPEQLERIAFFSADFGDYSAWDGTQDISSADKTQLVNVVDRVHAKGKQMRFWATPDGKNSWRTLTKLGVDIINTDQPAACRTYFNSVECEPVSSHNKENKIAGLQVAVLTDIHLQDVFGEFEDTDYQGVRNPKDRTYALIRSMEAQLHSTRLFNENYFVFLAALDNIAQRNIKYVIIPGDFSDDGQAINIRALTNILAQYSRLHDMSFFLTIGNHDVVQPFGRESGKRDFLGRDGKPQPIMSKAGIYKTNTELAAPAVITSDIKNLGYLEVIDFVGHLGFLPKEDDIYWETPFSEYDYDSYSFQEASKSAALADRSYSLPINGVPIPDMSYLVEPVDGLWLLALDGNTYLKRTEGAGGGPDYVNNGGYNAVIKHRKYLVDWVSKVTGEAERRRKTLICFSHYPMVDFNDGATELINELTKGEQRAPKEEVGVQFADAGLRVHFGGHMHINDTGILTTEEGNTLINIQVPSLAAYLPAYKLLTIGEDNRMNIETIVMDTVPRFDQFFELYKQEYNYLDSIGDDPIWNRKILDSKNYREFINWHLTELVRLRLLPREWPADFTALVSSLSGAELLTLSLTNSNLPLTQRLEIIRKDTEKSSAYWKNAIEVAGENNLSVEELETWSGFDVFLDYYRLRGADELAYTDIGANRLAAYKLIIASFLKDEPSGSEMDDMSRKLTVLMAVLRKFLNGDPAGQFELDLGNGKIFIASYDKCQKYTG